MTTCLILGGNGFIGSHLAEGLVEKGYEVTIFDKFPNGITNLETIKNKIKIIKGDFFNETDLRKSLQNIDYVFHYISTTIPATAKNDPIYDIESNVVNSIKLFQIAIKSNIKKVIFSSSGGTIYGEPEKLPIREDDPANPIDPYGISKLTIEKYLHYFNCDYGLDYIILRYSNPYGERQNPLGRQGVIPIFLNRIKKDEQPVVYGDGSMVRDYIYIKDAIEATTAIFAIKTKERVFNIGSGEGTSINQLIDCISRIMGKKIIPKYTKENTNNVKNVVLDISKIKGQINWKPHTNLEEGIKRTYRWLNLNF